MAELLILGIGLVLCGFVYESSRYNILRSRWGRERIRQEGITSSTLIYYDYNGNPHVIHITELQNNNTSDYSHIIDAHTVKDIAKSDMGYCPISLDPIKIGDKIRTLNCGHTFLLEPINLWLKNNLECPLCRHKFNEKLEN